MRVYVEPAIDRWRPSRRKAVGRELLVELTSKRAVHLSTAPLHLTHCLIATGHQPWLWHPGILAKDIAASVVARRFGGQPIHLVVDQDGLNDVTIELPVVEGQCLSVQRIVLAPCQSMVPLCCQPPADFRAIRRVLARIAKRRKGRVAVNVQPLIDAFRRLPACRTLAEQLTVVLNRLRRPILPAMPVIFASELAGLDGFTNLLGQMLADPQRCATCYNQAVSEQPDAGIAPLRADSERVELPLWALTWQQPRRRVFAEVVRGAAILGVEGGGRLDHECMTLAPRALLLTALMRADCSDLFIHGTGGAIYDQLTEQWIKTWLGRTLAPMTVVSADLHLNFDVPMAQARDVTRAKWWQHHLPHNLDRTLNIDGPEITRKRILLQQMNDDRDRVRRAKAFHEIHAINDDLARRYPEAIVSARRKLNEAHTGVANRIISAKRDWCFTLFPAEQLNALARQLNRPS